MARRRPHLPAVYAVVDAGALAPLPVPEAVEVIAAAGVRALQLRLKDGRPDGELYRTVEECRRRLEGSGAELWIDDRADLAALFDLPGLHLGQTDLPPAAARRVIGTGTWIGLSTHGDGEAAAAEADPEVDVVAIGPVFPTASKERPDPTVGLAGVAEARQRVAKPLVAIGGIDAGNVAQVLAAGADSAAVIGALFRGATSLAGIGQNCSRLLAAAGGSHRLGAMRIFLTGFMGAGKSEVGRLLARRLGLAFVDLDGEIEARAGESIGALFRREGEEGFRRRERIALEATARRQGVVVATGGGVVTSEANRDWMKEHGMTVWLNPSFETLAARLPPAAWATRPLLASQAQALELWQGRLPLYGTADLEVAVAADETAETTAERVAALVAERPCAT